MEQLSHTDLREHLEDHLDRVVADHTPVFVTPPSGKGRVVIIAADDLSAWQETVHLPSNSTNAARLLRSIRDADATSD